MDCLSVNQTSDYAIIMKAEERKLGRPMWWLSKCPAFENSQHVNNWTLQLYVAKLKTMELNI